MKDPWKHRSANMSCSTCMWFVLKETDEKKGGLVGRCRRHAPSQAAIGWPVVYTTDWCGDHKLDENKA